jgi:hypothetical protein
MWQLFIRKSYFILIAFAITSCSSVPPPVEQKASIVSCWSGGLKVIELPIESVRPSEIASGKVVVSSRHAGDILILGGDCVVVLSDK